jgi:hypothetical protein
VTRAEVAVTDHQRRWPWLPARRNTPAHSRPSDGVVARGGAPGPEARSARCPRRSNRTPCPVRPAVSHASTTDAAPALRRWLPATRLLRANDGQATGRSGLSRAGRNRALAHSCLSHRDPDRYSHDSAHGEEFVNPRGDAINSHCHTMLSPRSGRTRRARSAQAARAVCPQDQRHQHAASGCAGLVWQRPGAAWPAG